jgi:hypothetical protein
MSNMSPRRPRLSGPFPALLIALLGIMVLLALGFAVWGLVIYPATATDTPLPIVGTLTAIAEVATSPPTETAPLPPTATATSEAGDMASPTPEASPSATPGPTTAEPTATTPSPVDTATPTPTDTPLPPTPTPTLTPKPQFVNAFGYGIQAHALGNVNHQEIMATVKDLGFGWLKQQIEWKIVETAKGQYNWAEIDRLVEVAQQNGIYLLLSIVKAPDWARGPSPDTSVDGPPSNPQDLADFVRAMAARYKGRVQAYEIWNEQNLHYEWGNEQIDAARYVQLLATAYQAIRAADSRALVISGALTPAGSVPGDGRWLAIEDATYLRQMYDAGLKNYCDGVGAHPSGYNIPPNVNWQTYQDPNAQFRGLWDTPHYSWSFSGVMETYRQIMVEYGDAGKLIWVTEFGWAVDANPPGGREYAADNTREEQRDWTVTAYQMGKSWGWVGPMFLWNLNFRQIVPWSEQGMWSIIAGDGSLQPVYRALRDMPK